MMKNTDIIIFLGPSLSLEKAKKILPGALYFPPVKCGDILDVLKLRPKKIIIIDGYFESVAAVWHKEILFALANQIKVYGASSMGALRAAELADFGMIGVGKIFNDFYQHRLEDDDEVTVVHRPSQSGYVSITDAMVNLRYTFQKAVEQKIININTAEKLILISKAIFYKKRILNNILEICEQKYALLSHEINAFRDWLEMSQENFVDQKEQDAIELLEYVKKDISPHKHIHTLSRTTLLQKLLDRYQCEPMDDEKSDNTLLRYARLLAYTLKTAEYLNHIAWDTENIAIDHQEILSFYYGLALLFDTALLENPKTPYFKIVLFCAVIIFNIHKFLIAKNIFLNKTQKKQYLDEIIAFLPANHNQINHVNHEQLIHIYFILKDILNNSMDCFLSLENNKFTYSHKDYFQIAKEIILSLSPNDPP